MVFAPELEGLDRERIRDWYNGYSWGGAERVYNPFDVLLLLRKRKYKAWWFETGTPTFLVRTLAERQVHAATLEDALASEKLLGTFDVGRIATEALLFQTGYLTVAGLETENGREFYRLGYPNREVRESLNESLLDYLTGTRGGRRSTWARCGGSCGRGTSRGWRSASGRCSQRSRTTGTGATTSTASRGTTRA